MATVKAQSITVRSLAGRTMRSQTNAPTINALNEASIRMSR